MASSSVSQEDVENDYEFTSRRSRIRSARARINPTRLVEVNVDEAEVVELKPTESCSTTLAEHDMSPKPMGRTKEKRSSRVPSTRQPLADHLNRTNYVGKGKPQRDRRKLREKRRSTGVVHVQSTESTGGSTGEDEDELLSLEAKKYPIQTDQTLDDRTSPGSKMFQQQFRTKSPSDLDADDEDNQNQSDSTVSSLVQIPENKPESSRTPTIEEQMERLKEENIHLKGLLEEKEKLVSWLENRIQAVREEANIEKNRLKDEVARLMRAMASLHPN